MAPTVSRGIVIEAYQDEQVRALISRGLNYSDYVQAATDILLSGELAKYGGLTPGESLRRALDRAGVHAEIVVKRANAGPGWIVHLKAQPEVWEIGESQVEALGKWLVTHPEHSGLKIHWPPVEGAPRER